MTLAITQADIIPKTVKVQASVDTASNITRVYTHSRDVVLNEPCISTTVVGGLLAAYTGIDYKTQFNNEAGTDLVAVCTDIGGDVDDDIGLSWKWHYTFRTLTYKEERLQQLPTDRYPDIALSFDVFNRPVDFDKDGSPLETAAGDKFDPGVEEEVYYPRVSITKNYTLDDLPLSTLVQYNGKTNSAPFAGFDVGQVKMQVTGKQEQIKVADADYFYNSVNFELSFSVVDYGWQRKILNAGLNCYSGIYSGAGTGAIATNQRVKMHILMPGNNQPATEPQKLADNGRLLPEGADPVWLYFTTKDSIDFSPLGLDTYFA